MIATIDGPAGSGKSSTAKMAASQTGWYYLDSGSLYRACTLLYLRYGGSKNTMLRKLDSHEIALKVSGDEVITTLDGTNVENQIRTPEVSNAVSRVSALPEVREKVNAVMRETVKTAKFIADGRDLGTAVFPDADFKFFMVADLDTRAQRRYKEMMEKGIEASLEEIRINLKKRDELDSSRDIAPLKKPADAVEIDTTNLAMEEQVALITNTIQAK